MWKVKLREGVEHIKVTQPARAGREFEPKLLDSKARALDPSSLLCCDFSLLPQQTAALLGVSPAVLESLCFPSSLGGLRVMDLPPRRMDASPGSLLSMSVTLADDSLPSWSQSSHWPATGETSHMSPDSPKMNPDCPDKLGMYPWPLVEPITPRLSARGKVWGHLSAQ